MGCKTFETFSSALEWIAMTKFKIQQVLHLLDDFLFIAPSERLCQQQLNIFLEFCLHLGVPIAPEKTCGPSTTLSFVGIELDTVLKEARLPQDKLDKCVTIILEFQHRKKVLIRLRAFLAQIIPKLSSVLCAHWLSMHSFGLVRWPHPIRERVPLFNNFYDNWLNFLILQERLCHLNLLSYYKHNITSSTASRLIAQLSHCYFTYSTGVSCLVHFSLIVENPSPVISLLNSFRGLWNLAVLTSRYKGHSFCIGAASYAADRGFQILKFALWDDGNPMHLLNRSRFLLCLLNLVLHSYIKIDEIGWFTGVISLISRVNVITWM